MDSQPSGKLKHLTTALTRPIAVLLLLQLMVGMVFSPHRTFFPIYARELGYSAFLISTLATVQLAMGLIASAVGGSLSDGLGRKRTLLLGQIGFFLGCLIFFTSDSRLIAVLWTFSGWGLALHTLGGQSYLMDAAHPRYLGLLTAFYNWGYTLGGALSSPIAGFLLERWDYRVFGTALALFTLLSAALNQFILPPSPVPTKRQFASWKKLFGYGDVAGRPAVTLLVVLRFLPTFYWGMALILIPLLLNAAGASKILIAFYATVSQMAASLAQVAVGRAADRWGPKWPTVVTFVVLVTGILGIGIWPDRLWGVLAFGTLGTAAAWSLSTLLPSLVAEVTESQERGRVLGWIHLWWNAAMIVGSLVGGALFETWAGLPFLLAGILNVGSVGLVFLFYQIARRE